MLKSRSIVICALLGLTSLGCKGNSDTSAGAPAQENSPSVSATVEIAVDGKAWNKPSVGLLFNSGTPEVKPGRSLPFSKVLHNIGVLRFKAFSATDGQGNELLIDESLLNDSKTTVSLVVTAEGPTLRVDNPPASLNAKSFGILKSLNLSRVIFQMPDIDPNAEGGELIVNVEGKDTPYASSKIADESSVKMRRNGRDVVVLPLTELAPTGHLGTVVLKGSGEERTLAWPPSEAVYLYVSRRGKIHALIGETHDRHASGSGQTEKKASAAQSQDRTIRDIAKIKFLSQDEKTSSS